MNDYIVKPHFTELYPRAMRSLHWVIAVLILTTLICGCILGYDFVKGDTTTGKFLMSLHIACAMISFFLWFVRLLVRTRSTVPNIEGSSFQRGAARTVHFLLYVLTFTLPISGYAMDLVYGSAPMSFGLHFPDFGLVAKGPVNESLAEKFWLFHSYVGQGLGLLVLAHIAAAVYRSVGNRNDGIWRMIASREDKNERA
jgi:cytochrome b561